uniref:Uncharacterized protein n=1 Tax=Glossina pallidipes TaxID=7398 RepID=A0A1B0AEC3_GLOPL
MTLDDLTFSNKTIPCIADCIMVYTYLPAIAMIVLFSSRVMRENYIYRPTIFMAFINRFRREGKLAK